MCPVHLLFRLGQHYNGTQASILNSSGRRLAMMCFSLFLRKGKYENKLANCRGGSSCNNISSLGIHVARAIHANLANTV